MKKIAAAAAPIKPERFIDIGVLEVAIAAYEDWLEDREQEPTKNPLFMEGVRLAARFGPGVIQGIEQYLRPLAGLPGLKGQPQDDELKTELEDRRNNPITQLKQLKRYMDMGERGAGKTLVEGQARMFQALFTWLGSHPAHIPDVFPTPRAQKAARQAMMMVKAEEPEARLNKCASIPSVSAWMPPQTWMKKAAEVVGVPLSNAEEVIRDAESAANIGDNLRNIKGELATAVPNSDNEEDLRGEEQEALEQINEVAKESVNPTAVVAAAAVAATAQRSPYRTALAKKLGHSPEQEASMMSSGRVVIAAGAGSGKTRVLSSKVVYHINDLGTPATSILATTFTKKAAAELTKRVTDYGGVIEKDAFHNFGTTHSIAGNILNRLAQGFRRNEYFGGGSDDKPGTKWKQNHVLRLAMAQAQMKANEGKPPPKPEGLWEGAFVSKEAPISQAPEPTPNAPTPAPGAREEVEENEVYLDSIDNTLGYFQWAARTWSGGAGDYAKNTVQFLKDMREKSPDRLSPGQRSYLNKAFSKVSPRSPGGAVSFRVAAESELTDEESKEKSNRIKMKDYQFFGSPAREWFNIGADLTREDNKGNKKAIPPGEFQRAISIWKGKGKSPSEVYAEEEEGEGKDFAAVYAAYEWIKSPKGEMKLKGGDMDDILVDTVRALVGDPSLRKRLQAQYKVLLIDEAQDLNRVQHLLFGLLAGALDPKTLQPWPDKHMTADTFAFIGDDKQAIYEFRGADPDEFIDKSDLVAGGEGFKTYLLDTNYRSGSKIVNAAGALIAHNTKQIPMSCRTYDQKGEGAIVARVAASTEKSAANMAAEIDDLIQSGEVPPHDPTKGEGGYASFGVACRTNKEMSAYCVELTKRNIPFKCNRNPFNDKGIKAILGWLAIVESGPDGAASVVNPAVMAALAAPFAKINKDTLATNIKVKGKWDGNFVEFLLQPGAARKLYGGDWAKNLQVFIDNLKKAINLTGSSEEIMRQVLEFEGIDGRSVKGAMIDAVENDVDAMAELVAEAEDGKVSDEDIEERALAPLEPIAGLLKGRDKLTDALAYVQKLQDVNSKNNVADSAKNIDKDAVVISTSHGWKGLEVPRLYVPMPAGTFPSPAADITSERRLAYVALTRGEDNVVVYDIPRVNPVTKAIEHSQFISEGCIPYNAQMKEEQVEGKTAASDKWADDSPMMKALLAEDYDEITRLSALEKKWGEVI